jgi:hypothetical protein
MGNYYSSSVAGGHHNPNQININNINNPNSATNSGGAKLSKRMHNNFLDNLEKTNIMGGQQSSNELVGSGSTKKRNKNNINKSYNYNEQ